MTRENGLSAVFCRVRFSSVRTRDLGKSRHVLCYADDIVIARAAFKAAGRVTVRPPDVASKWPNIASLTHSGIAGHLKSLVPRAGMPSASTIKALRRQTTVWAP